MPTITMETLVKYHQFQNDSRALDMGVRSRVKEMKSKQRGMGICVRFKLGGAEENLKSKGSCEFQ